MHSAPMRRDGDRVFPRRVDYIGAAVLIVATAVWVLLRSGIAKSLIGSPKALLILAAGALLGLALAVGVWKLSKRPLVARAVGLVPLLAIFLWSEVAPQLKGPTTSADADPLAAATSISTPAEITAPNSVAAESSGPVESSAATSAPPTSTPTSSNPPAATLLGEGPVAGIDHQASGTAQLIRNANGSLTVRFENFSVEPGPSYRLFLVPGQDAETPQRGIDLGPFSTTEGAVNIGVPSKVVVDGPVTVLIWCDVYAVPVANATING